VPAPLVGLSAHPFLAILPAPGVLRPTANTLIAGSLSYMTTSTTIRPSRGPGAGITAPLRPERSHAEN
jgi:hypothetical protein